MRIRELSCQQGLVGVEIDARYQRALEGEQFPPDVGAHDKLRRDHDNFLDTPGRAQFPGVTPWLPSSERPALATLLRRGRRHRQLGRSCSL